MPKKTREEKMAAQLRRMKEQLGKQQATAAPAQEAPKPVKPTKQETTPPTKSYSTSGVDLKSTPATQPTKEVAERYNYAYVAGDLRKIAILAIAAIALEIILNLTTRASFAKLILRTLGIDI